MHTRTTRLLVVLIGILAIGLTGCDPEMIGDPIAPGQKSYFTVTLQPDPVVQRPNGIYEFTLTIQEFNGVGAGIDSIKIEYMQDTTIIDHETWYQRRVITELGTTRIEAFDVIRSLMRLDDCFGCNRANWLVRAHDDLGNYVQYSGSVKLISQ